MPIVQKKKKDSHFLSLWKLQKIAKRVRQPQWKIAERIGHPQWKIAISGKLQ